MRSIYTTLVLLAITTIARTQVPVITSFSPERADTGATLTIYGSSFVPDTALNIVYFGGMRGRLLTASADSIQVKVPVGAPYNFISVTCNNLTAYSKNKFVPVFEGARNVSEQFFSHRESFTLEQSYMFSMPNMMEAADMNCDGKNDFVITSCSKSSDSTYRIYIAINQSNSSLTNIDFHSFPTFAFGYNILGLKTADFDGDGKIDIAITEHTHRQLQFLQNTSPQGGYPTFKIPGLNLYLCHNAGHTPTGIAASDFNNDGKPDVVVADYGSDSLIFFKNRSLPDSIMFDEWMKIHVPGHPEFLAVTDLDNDGKTDIISSMNDYKICCFLNTSSGSTLQFAPAVIFPAGPVASIIKVADFNNDGLADLAVTNYDGAPSGWSVSILINNSTTGALHFMAPQKYYMDGIVRGLETGDLNGDGLIDLVAGTNTNANKVMTILLNTSTGGTVKFNETPVYVGFIIPTSFVITDINGDRKPDIFYSDVLSYNSLSVAFNETVTNDSLDAIYNSWAPVGAEWHYTLKTTGASYGYSYTQFNAVTDTLVQGKNCRKITKLQDPDCMYRPVFEIMYSSADTVFCLDTVSNTFYPLYIFNSLAGSSWTLPIDGDSLRITVDSVTTTQVNGLDLKTLWVNYTRENDLSFYMGPNKIIQRVGDTDFMFETFTGTECIGKYPDGLRCYEDDFTGLFKPFIASCTAVLSGIDDIAEESAGLAIYPNPAHNNVTIEMPESRGKTTCQITDITGRTVYFGHLTQKLTLDLSEISQGIYFVELQSSVKRHNQKLIIQ